MSVDKRTQAPVEGAASFELVGLRHRACGHFALFINAETVDQPDRAIMARDCFLPNGDQPNPAKPLSCQHCGRIVPINPTFLEIDRGPDHRQSLLQRTALRVADSILLGAKA